MNSFPYFNYELTTQLFILKTNVKTNKDIEALKLILNDNCNVIKWSIDTEDIDNVLKIEATVHIEEEHIINKMNEAGFYCDVLDS